jgi:MtrB/PioB family decaheme-associated outer membrane protein
MARLRHWLLLLLAALGGALPVAAEPPRDSLHPGNAEVWQLPDPNGLSLLVDSRRRTPSGLLYPYPPEVYPLSDLGAGWLGRGALETGYFWVSGDTRETRFTRYVERKDGPLLDLLDLELWRPDSGDYLMLHAGSVGRHDQFYDLEADRAGWLRFRGSFSGVPHNYASDAVSLFDGVGGSVLTLPAGLTPGASTQAEVAAALAGIGADKLDVQRDRTQLALRVRALPQLNLIAQYGLEDRTGVIPTGVGFAFPEYSTTLGGTLEVASPVDDQTQTARAGLEWGGDVAQLNLAYNGSFYRNRETSLTLAQPFESLGLAPIVAARLALAPDNEWHNIRADAAVNLPLRSRLTGVFSWSRSTQDQDLLPPTIADVTIGATDLANWNTTAALSTESAHARVDQLLVDIDLHLNPWRPLRLRGGFRYSDRDTHTNYQAFNPSTGQYGYVVEDGGFAATLSPDYVGIYQPAVPGSNWRYRNMPFGESQLTLDAGATLALPRRSSLDVLLKQNQIDRDVSERPDTTERSVTLSANSRALSFATARFSYQYITRDGGDIDYGVYANYETQSFPGFVPSYPDGEPANNLNQMVRPSVADLNGQVWNGRLIFSVGERSDLSLTGRLRSNDYDSDYGLRSDRVRGVEAEWTVQPSPIVSASAFISLEAHRRNMGSIRGLVDPFGSSPSDGNAGGPNFPFSNQWSTNARGDAVGWGGRLTLQPLDWLELDTRYTFLVTREEDQIAFTNPLVLANPDFSTPPQADFPNLRSRDQAVETTVRIALNKSVGLRLYYRYWRSGVDDYHQTDLPTQTGRRVYLGHEDRDYTANFFGVAVQVAFGSGR